MDKESFARRELFKKAFGLVRKNFGLKEPEGESQETIWPVMIKRKTFLGGLAALLISYLSGGGKTLAELLLSNKISLPVIYKNYLIQKYQVPDIIRIGDPNKPFIYPTIDDCQDPGLVRSILNVARERRVLLTFFPKGNVVIKDPDLWRQVYSEGHQIENHTQNHRRLSELRDDEIGWEIGTQFETLKTIIGPNYQQKFLRPPYGDGIFNYDPRVVRIAKDHGLKIAMWTADSEGYKYGSRTDLSALETVWQNINRNLRNGSIVLQHVNPTDLAVLPRFLDEAKKRGFISLNMSAGLV